MTVRVGVIGTGVMGAGRARVLHGSVSSAMVMVVADVSLEASLARGNPLTSIGFMRRFHPAYRPEVTTQTPGLLRAAC